MQVLLDTRNTGRTNGTGISSYTNTLANALSYQPDLHIGWLQESRPDPTATLKNTLSTKVLRLLNALKPGDRRAYKSHNQSHDLIAGDIFRIAHIHFKIFGKILTLNPDIPPDLMHWTCPLPLQMTGCPNIVTIHDLIPVLHPEYCQTDPARTKKLFQTLIDRADTIVTISETVRNDILNTFTLAPDRLVTIPQVTNISFDLPPASTVAPCPEGSFVYVGSLERRKNISRLIKAHALSRTDRYLVLIGPKGFHADEELAALSSHPRPERVLRLPWIEKPQLIKAIQTARALVFPSLAEGFGLPIIEAMALRTPVLTSQGGTTEEVAGDAACLVDPHSIQSIADGLARLDKNDSFCEELRLRGIRNITRFETQDYGEKFSALYRRIVH